MEDTIVICFLHESNFKISSTYHTTKTIFRNYRSSTLPISMIFEYIIETNILNNSFFYV